MEFRQLRTFRAVAATRSITQAAASLSYAQSSVSVQIQALEKELGVPLIDHVGRTIQLTEAGERLLRYAERLIDLADEAQKVVSDVRACDGTLSIGAPETICTYRLPPVLREFRRRFPKVQLSFRPMLDVDLYAGVRAAALDIGFLLQEPVGSNGIRVETLIEEPLVVICAPGHVLAQKPHVRPADLEGETLLLTEVGCGYRHLFEQSISKGGVYAVIKLEFTSVEAIKACVGAGLGIGFLPQVAVDRELAEGSLCAVDWEKSFQVCTQLITHKDKWISPPMEEFIRLCRERLGESGE
jgi:DNA-binding transcriptional LysR family regulator